MNKEKENERFNTFAATLSASPYDGAYALSKAMERLFGFSVQDGAQVQVVVNAKGETISVPWGRFEVPGIGGYIYTDYTFEDDRVVFQVVAEIQNKYRDAFNKLIDLARKVFLTESIYRGKDLHAEFSDKRGSLKPIPEIKFMDTQAAVQPIFNRDIEDQMKYDVNAYLTHSEEIRAQHGTLKRGILLAGPYGTGKTLTAGYMAKLAVENGFTFIYTTARDVPHALDFAQTYQPAVVFAEDVESVAGHERTDSVNTLLNKLDGVDSKHFDVIAVFTTNHSDKLSAAMLRPGRIDVVVNVLEPDSEAVMRLVNCYAKSELVENDDFSEAVQMLAGMIPAVIAEAVSRARVRALVNNVGSELKISNADLVGAAKSVRAERNVIAAPQEQPHPAEAFGTKLGESLGKELDDTLTKVFTSPNGRSS